ncbi:MAG: universal stress protein [Kofleriaceae bacterium]
MTAVSTGPRRPLGGIVVGIDPSPHSRQALDRAVRIPLQMGASLDLIYAIDEERYSAIVAHREGEARQLLDEARATAERFLPSAGLHDAVTSFAWGTPFAVIADRAHHGRAELVVVGRHGERRFRDLVIGSTAERVIRKGSVSVLVVATPPETAYRRPLVAVDMSDSSRLALELAARISDPKLDAIDVVHVIPMPSRPYVSGGELVPTLEGRRDEVERSVREELLRFLGTVDAGVRWNLTVKFGDARAVILEEAKQRNTDLLALGTKGRTGLARVFVGSVAEGVIRSAGCDVLVARRPKER